MHLNWPLRIILLWTALALAPSLVFGQSTQQLTFDEVEYTSVDGLAVKGVEFAFEQGGVSSPDAYYGSFGPGSLTQVTDPSLVGPAAGKLTMSFAAPTQHVQFGLAVSLGESLSNAAQASLFDSGGALIVNSPIDTIASDPLSFSESRFTYDGAAVSRIELTFNSRLDSFALDNLVYNVPEPASLVLLCVGSALLLGIRRR